MKILDRIADVGLRRHLARSTIACYQGWVADFLRFSLETTMIYTHIMQKPAIAVRSPLDRLQTPGGVLV